MYIVYDKEYNANVRKEQANLIFWIKEAIRLNPEVPIQDILDAANDWVKEQSYSIPTRLPKVEDPNVPVEASMENIEPVSVVDSVEEENPAEAVTEPIEPTFLESEDELVEAPAVEEVLADIQVVEEDTDDTHITHSVSQEEAVEVIEDTVEGDNIEETFDEEEVEESNEFDVVEVKVPVEEPVEASMENIEPVSVVDSVEEENPAEAVTEPIEPTFLESEDELVEAPAVEEETVTDETEEFVLPTPEMNITEETFANIEEEAVEFVPAIIADDNSNEVSIEDFMNGNFVNDNVAVDNVIETETAVEDIMEAPKAEEEVVLPPVSINDAVDFSSRKRRRGAGSVLKNVETNEQEENVSGTPKSFAVGRRGGVSGNIADDKQSRVQENISIIFRDPDAIADL